VAATDEETLRHYGMALEALLALGGDWHTTAPVLTHGTAPPYTTLVGDYVASMVALAAHAVQTSALYAAEVLRRSQTVALAAMHGDHRLLATRLGQASMVTSPLYYQGLADWLEGKKVRAPRESELGPREHKLVVDTMAAIARHEAATRARALAAWLPEQQLTPQVRVVLQWLVEHDYTAAGDTARATSVQLERQAHIGQVFHQSETQLLALLPRADEAASFAQTVLREHAASISDALARAKRETAAAAPVTLDQGGQWTIGVKALQQSWASVLSRMSPGTPGEEHHDPIRSLARLVVQDDAEARRAVERDWGWRLLDWQRWDEALVAARAEVAAAAAPAVSGLGTWARSLVTRATAPPEPWTWAQWVASRPTLADFSARLPPTWDGWIDPMSAPKDVLRNLSAYSARTWWELGLRRQHLATCGINVGMARMAQGEWEKIFYMRS